MAGKPKTPAAVPAEPREERDEAHGHGGSYVVNEAGQRELVERTELPKDPTGDETPAAASEE